MDYCIIDDLIPRILVAYMPEPDSKRDMVMWLFILKIMLMDFPEGERSWLYKDLFRRLQEIIPRYQDIQTDDLIQLGDLMQNIDFGVGQRPRSFIVEEPLFAHNYTKTNPLGSYDHICRCIEELELMEEDDSHHSPFFLDNNRWKSHDSFDFVVNFYLRFIQYALQDLRPSFKVISDQRKEWLGDDNDTKSVMRWITSLVYEVEYILDSIQSRQCPRLESALWLTQVFYRLPIWDRMERVEGIIKELPSLVELDSKESIINYVVSTDGHHHDDNRHQLIPIINYDDEDIGETLRQIFNDEKIASTFAVLRLSLAGLPDSPHLIELCETKFREVEVYTGIDVSKEAKEYSKTLSPEEFTELAEALLVGCPKYLAIFENVKSELQSNLLELMIKLSVYNPPSKILYTTQDAEVALNCRFNSPKIFYIPRKINNTPDVTIDREVVGFSKEKKDMLVLLTKGDLARCVISIAGMPGLGKTTLAKLLYKHPSVTQHFHVRAFCTVSQIYKLRELLLQLVLHFCQVDDTLHGLEDIELAAEICKSLKRQRYLIVLDDIWDIDAWKALMNCFPDDKNGSRIIITTRQTELMPSNIQSVNLLSDVECWELLEKEVFQDQNRLEELSTIGKTIARNCKGLPLSVILIAGFLKKLNRTKAVWQKVADTLTSALDIDVEAQRKGIMDLSYKHLPDCLQPCFLYFGIFPEDNKIPAEKLIRLWSAEGFLLQNVGEDTQRVEDVAANYLIDLAGRSLITIAEMDLSGKVKSYQVHDLIREFCITKAQEENFFLRLSGYGELSAYSNSLIEDKVDEEEIFIWAQNRHYFNKLPLPSGPRRLSIHCERKQFVETRLSSLPLVRSMLFIADKSEMFPNNTYDVSFIFNCFKLLKILDLEEVTIEDSSLPLIFKLVLLKYLAVSSDAERIPGDLCMLSNLETLIFKSSKADKIIQVPDSFWDMTKLRHVHISGNPDFDLDPKRVENTSTLVPKNLQTFSSPSLSVGGKLEKVLPRLQSIRKLKCRFSDQSLNTAKNGQLFPDLDFLTNLESLKVVYNMQQNFEFTSGEFKFPEYLTKLSLSNFCMPWKEISQLTKLKALEVLKIQNSAWGETLDMSEQDEAFENLKVLKLDALDIVNWCGVSAEHFPKLKHLLLWNLENLKEIPVGIGNINALDMIDVKWCSSSAEESAKRIKEEWDEYGNEIKITILSKTRETGSALEDELE